MKAAKPSSSILHEKFVCDKSGLENLIVHYRKLKTYNEVGQEITETHPVISFNANCSWGKTLKFVAQKSNVKKLLTKMVENYFVKHSFARPTEALRIEWG